MKCRKPFDWNAVIAAAVVTGAMLAGLLAAKLWGVKVGYADMLMIDAGAAVGVVVLQWAMTGRRPR